MVSMETDKKWNILRWSKNVWLFIIKSCLGSACKILAFHGQIEPQSLHFQISMATIWLPWKRMPLAPAQSHPECSCRVWMRSVHKRPRRYGTDGRTDGRTDGQTDRQTDGRTNPNYSMMDAWMNAYTVFSLIEAPGAKTRVRGGFYFSSKGTIWK